MKKRWNIPWQTAALLLLLSGCATGRYIRNGEQAMLAHNPVEARNYFERALSRKPKLSRDALFMEKLRVVRRDACMIEAYALRSRGQWHASIIKYEEALEYNPSDPQALSEIAQTRRMGSLTLYDEALKAADKKDLKGARLKLSKALSLLPDDPLSARAGKSLDAPEEGLTPEQLSVYQAGVVAEADRNWQPACDAYTRVVGNVPWHLPARAGKTRSREQVVRADALAREAERAFSGKSIPRARQLLAELKRLYPRHDRYPEILADIERVEAQVNALLLRAGQQYEAGEFDASLRICNEALGLYPGYSPARKRRDAAEEGAVDACLDQADDLLGRGAYRDAAEHYSRVFRYRFGHRDAKEGLALISSTIAMEHRREGRDASALLWAMHAESKMQNAISAVTMEQLRERIMNRHLLNMNLVVESPSVFASEAAWLNADLTPELIQMSAAPPSYTIAIEVVDAFAETRTVREDNINHPYDVPIEVSNPRWYQLERNACHLREHYAVCEAGYAQSQSDYQHFKREANLNHPADMATLQHLRQRRNRAEEQMRCAGRELRRAEHELAFADQIIVEYERHYWNYQTKVVEQVAALKVRMLISDPAGTPLREGEYFEKEIVSHDTMVINPNPDIGVDEDPLELPSPVSMQRAAVSDVANACYDVFSAEILHHFMTSLTLNADTAEDHETGLECRLASWMMQQIYAPGESSKSYQLLMDEVAYPM